MFGWFGQKESYNILKGVGSFIDEQQLTKEEQLKYRGHWLKQMEPFKVVQRIIVSIIMAHWALWGINCMIAIWLQHFTGNQSAINALIAYAQLELVYLPTIAAVSVYLSGGIPFLQSKTK